MHLKSGEKVLILKSSHIHGASCLELFKKSVVLINSENRKIITEEVEFPEIIGTTNVVKISPADKIIWAQRKGRKIFSKFVLNKKTEPTNFFSFALKRYTKNSYLLLTCYKGKKSEKEINFCYNEQKALDFWKSHAFVWGTEIIEEPIIFNNPYEN